MIRPAILIAALSAQPAIAHDAWIHGEPVPAWVKADCCGQADAHRILPEAVHITAGGYQIDGLPGVIPFSRVLPSQDGAVWVFFNERGLPDPQIFCAFFPVNGV
jgi:hypothetical protein